MPKSKDYTKHVRKGASILDSPELEVVKEVVDEKPVQAGVIIKFIVLILLPILYSLGLVMLLLHFAGVNIQTQVKTVENVTKPIISLIDAPQKKSSSEGKKDTNSSSEKETNNEQVPYSSENSEETSKGDLSNQTVSQIDNEIITSSNMTEGKTESNNVMIESSNDIYSNLNPEQIATIFMGIADRNEVLRQFKKLDSKTASKVITLLNPELAGWIVTQMD